ncbi:hypothetical protein EUTSA_v10003422mg [Eutrema salsugineum]|uniref:Uncharacterized protein n=1 Tax=Eutrema salsugineum TaxID=72664 RepID=V4LLI1_EUTSA|nr:hypothetical protein EUTSA_v10003422mg [Eutrema salsugineum]
MRAGEVDDDKEGVCKVSVNNLAHHIPPDLEIEILTRLLIKSLKRFQCVSKEWSSIIQSQVFIDSFISLSQTRSRFLVAVRSAKNRVALLSSRRFTICNPCTRQIITLPDLKAKVIREDIYMFLGYDPVGNEYKALCSTVLFGERFQEHKVLILGGGNLSWRNIKGRKTKRYNVVTNGVCINGMVYFGGWTTREQEKEPRIFRFDVRCERMSSIRTFSSFIACGSLLNYNGMLAAVYPNPREPLRGFVIWVLDVFDKFRWKTDVFHLHPLLADLSGKIQLNFLGMNKSGEVILGPLKLPPRHEPLYIFYYNGKGAKNYIRRVELEGFEEFGCNHTSDEQCVCQLLISPEHFESLVPF